MTMTTATLRYIGKSMVVTIPREILRHIDWQVGTQVNMNVQDGKLIIELKEKRRYTLAELLTTCTEENMALTEEDQAWLEAKPVGKEVL
jgi:antitoxin ChpS